MTTAAAPNTPAPADEVTLVRRLPASKPYDTLHAEALGIAAARALDAQGAAEYLQDV